VVSVLTGELCQDTPHSVRVGDARFPVVEGIAYLRSAREELAAAALRHLDQGDERSALLLLLKDQDDWARTGAPARASSMSRVHSSALAPGVPDAPSTRTFWRAGAGSPKAVS